MNHQIIVKTRLEERALPNAPTIEQETIGMWKPDDNGKRHTLNYFDADTKSPCTLQLEPDTCLLRRGGTNALTLPFDPATPQCGTMRTPFGTADLQVETTEYTFQLNSEGGHVCLCYALGNNNWPRTDWPSYRLEVTFTRKRQS